MQREVRAEICLVSRDSALQFLDLRDVRCFDLETQNGWNDLSNPDPQSRGLPVDTLTTVYVGRGND